MAIRYKGVGSWATSTSTTVTVTLPTHAAGDLLIVRAIRKPYSSPTSMVINTSGWNATGTQYANGTTANGTGVGSMAIATFYKVAASSSETSPVVTWGATAAPGAVVAVVYEKDAWQTWVNPTGVGGVNSTAATTINDTLGTHIAVNAGDMVDIFVGWCDDSGTPSAVSISQTGVTYSVTSDIPATALDTSTSNDLAADGGYASATAGPSSAAATITASFGSSEEHIVWMTRMRALNEQEYAQAQASIKALDIQGYANALAEIQSATSSNRAYAQALASIYARQILLVVADSAALTTGDQMWADHLRTGLGANVTLISDETAEPSLAGYDAIVISESCTSTTIGSKYKTASIGIVTAENGAWDDLGLITGTAGADDAKTQLIFSGTHAIIWDVPTGTQTVTSATADFRHSANTHGANAVKIASTTSSANDWVVFAYESGVTIADSTTAAGRRVALGYRDTGLYATLNAYGWAIFDAAVRWALGESNPTFDKTSLLVLDTGVTQNQSEHAVVSRLRDQGISVDIVDDGSLTTGQANGYDLVLMSKTVDSVTIGTTLKNSTAPVLFWEDNQQQTSMIATIDNSNVTGTAWHGTGTNLVINASAPTDLKAGLSGTVTFLRASGEITYAPKTDGGAESLVAGATRVAYFSVDGQWSIYAVGQGTTLADSSAALGPRAYFGLYDDTFRYLTLDGVNLFNALVEWSLNQSVSPQKYAQAQAQIASGVTVTTYRAYGQAHARIKQTYPNTSGANYDAIVVADGPIAFWKLDETLVSNAYLVVGNSGSPTTSDAAIKTRLEGMGYTVTYVDDGDTAPTESGYGLVVIAESCTGATVSTKYSNFTIPVITLDGAAAVNMDMQVTTESSASETQVTIGDTTHLAAANYSGNVTVFSSAGTLRFATDTNLGSGYQAWLERPTVSGQKVAYGYAAGATMLNSHTAEARRAYLGLFHEDTTSIRNDATWQFFDGVVAWAVNNVATDTMGDYNANYWGVPSSVTGLAPSSTGAKLFNGIRQRITQSAIGKLAAGDWTNGFSLEAWFKPAQSTNEEHIVAFSTSTGSYAPALMRDETSDKLTYRDDGDAGASSRMEANSAASTGTTYYIVATKNSSGNGVLYINATSQTDTGTSLVNPPTSTGLFTIAGEYDVANFPLPTGLVEGTIDRVAVYNFPLTGTQVSNHYNATGGVVGPTFAQAQATIVSGTATGRGHSQANTAIAGSFSSVVDTFTRTVSDGFGSADTGGAYTIETYNTRWDVNGSVGTITNADQPEFGYLGKVAVTNYQSSIKYSYNLLPTGTTPKIHFNIKGHMGLPDVLNNGNAIYGGIRISNTGAVEVSAGAYGQGSYTSIGDTYNAGETWYLVTEVFETTTSALIRVKTWKVGTNEPGWQHIFDSAGYSLVNYKRFAGFIGIDTTSSGTVTNAPTLTLDDWNVITSYHTEYAQSQAQIKQAYRVYAQAQANIKIVYRSYAQAQARIKQSYRGYAQAQSQIKQAYLGYGQAQARIKQTYQSYAQANAWIEQRYIVHAQAQSQIKQAYRSYAQAQSQIKQAYQGYGQAQARIKQTYQGYGQSQTGVKTYYQGFGQAQGAIKSSYKVYAQAQGQIKQSYRGNAQALATVEQAYQSYAQAQARVKQIYQTYGQANAWIKLTFSGYANAQAQIEQTYNSYAQAQSQIKQTYRTYAQAQAQIKQAYQQYGQTQAQIEQAYRVYAQAQGQIKQAYRGYGQALAHIYRTERSYAQSQSQIKQSYRSYAQANTLIILSNRREYAQAIATIEQRYIQNANALAHIFRTEIGFAQAQAQIEQTYRVHAQAQASIEQVYRVYAQSNAYIRLENLRGYAQAQASIKQRYIQNAQSQSQIKTSYIVYAQSQALIEQITRTYGQAQVNIKRAYISYAQAQAQIKQVYLAYANAQAQIKQSYQVYGQSNTWIEVTNNKHAQALSWIEITSIVYAQANAWIEITNLTYAQANAYIKIEEIKYHANAQAQIKQSSIVWAQAQTDIKSTYRVYAQSLAQIEQSYLQVAQSLALVKSIYNLVGQAQARLIAFNVQSYANATTWVAGSFIKYAQAQAKINAFAVNSVAQAQTNIKATYREFGQAQSSILVAYRQYAQAQTIVKTITQQYGQAQADIKQAYQQWAQANTYIIISNIRVFAQANALIISGKAIHAQAQAQIKAVSQGYAQAGTLIAGSFTIHAQAQAKINAYNVRSYGQSIGLIKQVYQAYGQAQGAIRAEYRVYAQAATAIKQVYQVYGQAQVTIETLNNVYAQANAWIEITTIRNAQAQARIVSYGIQKYGQASVWIAGAFTQVAQAQAYVKAIAVTANGQSQALVKASYQVYGQALALIRITSRVFAQAQAIISSANYVNGQAQVQIKAVNAQHGQALTTIKSTGISYAQANTLVKINVNTFAQANAYIKSTKLAYANSAAYIKAPYIWYGQSQAQIKQSYQKYGNAQVSIEVNVNVYAQATTWIKIYNYVTGQAEALIVGAKTVQAQALALIVTSQAVHAQAQVLVVKGAGYGQAIALIRVVFILNRLIVSDNSISLVLSDSASMTLTLSDTSTVDIISDRNEITLAVSDTPSLALVLSDRNYWG